MSQIEFTTLVYPAKEYEQYMNNMYPNTEQDPDASEQWKIDMLKQEAKFPDTKCASVFINPEYIVAAMESISIKEMHENGENAKFDSMELFLTDGVQIIVSCLKAEYLKKISKK